MDHGDGVDHAAMNLYTFLLVGAAIHLAFQLQLGQRKAVHLIG